MVGRDSYYCRGMCDTAMHGGHQGRERIPMNFGPPTDDEPFRYKFKAPLGT